MNLESQLINSRLESEINEEEVMSYLHKCVDSILNTATRLPIGMGGSWHLYYSNIFNENLAARPCSAGFDGRYVACMGIANSGVVAVQRRWKNSRQNRTLPFPPWHSLTLAVPPPRQTSFLQASRFDNGGRSPLQSPPRTSILSG